MSLGMKPLHEGEAPSKEDEARARGEELARAAGKEKQEEALREKIEDAKRKRLLHQKMNGSSLGEMLEGEEMDSAVAWIEKSRRQENARTEKRKEGKPRKHKVSSEQLQVNPRSIRLSVCYGVKRSPPSPLSLADPPPPPPVISALCISPPCILHHFPPRLPLHYSSTLRRLVYSFALPHPSPLASRLCISYLVNHSCLSPDALP
ncbi:MAG: hypothetical protein SGPRY_013486 [Prymnesium sp.]